MSDDIQTGRGMAEMNKLGNTSKIYIRSTEFMEFEEFMLMRGNQNLFSCSQQHSNFYDSF